MFGFNLKILEMFNDGSLTAYNQEENYLIVNYEPGNAKERYEGKEDGKGTRYYRNGQKLIGNCYDGKVHGSAKLVSANGDILRSGTFKETYEGLYFVEEELKILSGKMSDFDFTAEGKAYFANNKIYIGVFEIYSLSLQVVGEGQLIDDNGEKIEEGTCSLKLFTDNADGVEYQHGIYFGEETTGAVSGKIYLTNGKTYQGEFENQKHDGAEYFNPIEGTLFSYDGTVIQKGKWERGQFVG
jgi:hypothetical protein